MKDLIILIIDWIVQLALITLAGAGTMIILISLIGSNPGAILTAFVFLLISLMFFDTEIPNKVTTYLEQKFDLIEDGDIHEA